MRTPLIPRPRRVAVALAAGVLLATGATACETAEPAAFTVVPAATGADATPGDGTCANAEDACSLQAAVEEANALDTATTITVPADTVAPAELTVTGAVTLVAEAHWQRLADVSWAVVDGAQLTVTDADLGPVVVDGTFLARRVALGTTSDGSAPISGVEALVQVGPTGTALLTNAVAVAWGAPLATNAGVLSIHGATVSPQAAPGDPAITTETGGQTRLSASAFLGGAAAVDVCGGSAPTSYGYNLMPDATCGPALTGDRQDFDETALEPEPGTPRVDASPVGTLHCGAGWTHHVAGDGARPRDGDLDEVAACDNGAHEVGLAA